MSIECNGSITASRLTVKADNVTIEFSDNADSVSIVKFDKDKVEITVPKNNLTCAF